MSDTPFQSTPSEFQSQTESLARAKNISWLVFTLFLVALDQITKLWIKGFSLFGVEHIGMMLGDSYPVFGDWLRITFVENPGMAFGVTFGPAKAVLSLFSVVASGGLAWFLMRLRTDSFFVKFGIMLVLAGAAGNMIDRVFYGSFYGYDSLLFGKVVDFVDVEFPDFTIFGTTYNRWPVFNIADSCVSIGMIILLFVNHKIPFGKEQSSMPIDDLSSK